MYSMDKLYMQTFLPTRFEANTISVNCDDWLNQCGLLSVAKSLIPWLLHITYSLKVEKGEKDTPSLHKWLYGFLPYDVSITC